jgi:proteasome beta subunit
LSNYIDTHRLHGTTTVGLECSDGIVLATDNRATAGFLYIAHRNVKKIARIDDHVALTMAGTVADAQNMVDILRYHANTYRLQHRRPIPIRSCARLASNVFFANRFYPYIIELLVGGYDERPELYKIDLFGSINKEKFVSTGSGSFVAYGILENEFREDINVDEGAKIAARAINAAILRNAGTGDGIDVVIISAKGYKELTREEKSSIILR